MPDTQNSSATGLRIAEESTPGVLPGTPIWVPHEPNSYRDFGGSITTVARAPISSSRQQKKGVVTDLDAAGGFNEDLTQTNLADLLQGFFFASFRRKGEEVVTAVDIDTADPDEYEVAATAGFYAGSLIFGSGFTNAENNGLNLVTAIVSNTSVEVATGLLVDEGSPPADAKITVVGFQFGSAELEVDASGTLPILNRVSGTKDLTELGLVPGEWIYIGGDAAGNQFVTAANNGFARVRSVSATQIVLDKAESTMVTDAGTGKTIRLFFGRVLKNEAATIDQVTRTYQLERTLGSDDNGEQSEYLVQAYASEVTFSINTADKAVCDISFIAGDHEQYDGTAGVKSGTRPAIDEADAWNTSSDFQRFKMAIAGSSDEAPTALFAYLTEATLTINNNLSPQKAVANLGAIGVTVGNFVVSGSLTAYFSEVAAVQAVRNNSDVTLDLILAKNNVGIALDMPLVTLGDGRLNVEANQPIRLPLTMAAAEGTTVNSGLNHTALMVFFDYLPDAAAP